MPILSVQQVTGLTMVHSEGLANQMCRTFDMADEKRPSIKKADTYEALREDGASKQKAARIANAQASDTQSPSKKGGAASPYEEWTKDALYDRAKELEISGWSSMTKDDLITALREN